MGTIHHSTSSAAGYLVLIPRSPGRGRSAGLLPCTASGPTIIAPVTLLRSFVFDVGGALHRLPSVPFCSHVSGELVRRADDRLEAQHCQVFLDVRKRHD